MLEWKSNCFAGPAALKRCTEGIHCPFSNYLWMCFNRHLTLMLFLTVSPVASWQAPRLSFHQHLGPGLGHRPLSSLSALERFVRVWAFCSSFDVSAGNSRFALCFTPVHVFKALKEAFHSLWTHWMTNISVPKQCSNFNEKYKYSKAVLKFIWKYLF